MGPILSAPRRAVGSAHRPGRCFCVFRIAVDSFTVLEVDSLIVLEARGWLSEGIFAILTKHASKVILAYMSHGFLSP